MEYRLLIVDDEEGIRWLLKDYFEIQEYQVLTAGTGEEAVRLALGEQPDLILLDISLPDIDGLEVCRQIREKVNCPILFLTARVEEQDRINGFLMGGDDYIVKPFSIEELGARVMAHLRREKRSAEQKEQERGLSISYSQRQIRYQGQEIRLTKTEFDIVEFLSMNPGQVFSREQIYEKVRGIDGEGDNSIIMEHIRRIRNKIRAVADQDYIETVWGVGYKWIG
ncbi:MAG TPA: response regulator transcription factor [Candidatus Blautia stercoripullorum]|uniref:Stage 0 sporulation protein A homolog n=1 Tax=Candidatus Blautia stercoripullorum TaxID=2838502 RepID=A0A9D2REB5_9FIRM|nr:response regulator transcription factor [Candidatus Blautia stercoripullorum]